MQKIIFVFLILIPSTAYQQQPPQTNQLAIRSLNQAPGLCGTTVAEMIMLYAGIDKLGKHEQYQISDISKGSAVAQYLCDLMMTGEVNTNQPQCVDQQGNAIVVYKHGRPSKATRKAYVKGTYLLGLKQMFALYDIDSKYQRSLFDSKIKQYTPELNYQRFPGFLAEVKAGKAVIIHVTPRLKRGGGHYLLVYGYDDMTKKLFYIDPNPGKGRSPRNSVAYTALENGAAWFRGSWFWTGRYLAVNVLAQEVVKEITGGLEVKFHEESS